MDKLYRLWAECEIGCEDRVVFTSEKAAEEYFDSVCPVDETYAEMKAMGLAGVKELEVYRGSHG